DFNGDGITDLLVQNQSSHQSYIAFMNVNNVTASTQLSWLDTVNWNLMGLGDFNADVKTDIVAWQTSNAYAHILVQDGTGNVTNDSGLSWLDNVHWAYQGVGDFNGDGKTDLIVRNLSTNDTHLAIMDGGGNVTQDIDLTWLNPSYWTLTQAADFNGDG